MLHYLVLVTKFPSMDSTIVFSSTPMKINQLLIFFLAILLFTLVHFSVPNGSAASISGTASMPVCCADDEFHPNIAETGTKENAAEKKSKSRARLYSLAATTVPLALAMLNARGYRMSEQSGTSIIMISSGILIGPSAGSIYADDWTLAKQNILIRSFCAALLVSGHFIKRHGNSRSLGQSLQISSGLLLAGHALYDTIFLSAHSVEYHNARIRMEAGLSFVDPVPQTLTRRSDPEIHTTPKLLPGLGIRLLF